MGKQLGFTFALLFLGIIVVQLDALVVQNSELDDEVQQDPSSPLKPSPLPPKRCKDCPNYPHRCPPNHKPRYLPQLRRNSEGVCICMVQNGCIRVPVRPVRPEPVTPCNKKKDGFECQSFKGANCGVGSKLKFRDQVYGRPGRRGKCTCKVPAGCVRPKPAHCKTCPKRLTGCPPGTRQQFKLERPYAPANLCICIMPAGCKEEKPVSVLKPCICAVPMLICRSPKILEIKKVKDSKGCACPKLACVLKSDALKPKKPKKV